MQIFLFFALFIAIIAIIFAVQNNDTTTVSFLVWKTDGSLALVLLISIAAGALISYLFSLPSSIKSRLTVRNLRKEVQDLEARIIKYEEQLMDTRIEKSDNQELDDNNKDIKKPETLGTQPEAELESNI